MQPLRPLSLHDVPRMVEINEQGLPGTGKVTEEEMADLLSLSEFAMGLENQQGLAGFVLCLMPKTRYGSLNYKWFNERYDEFLYVDRVAVAEEARSGGLGSALYDAVAAHAERLACPMTAEVRLRPPNPGSMRFHARPGFNQIGVFEQAAKAVTQRLRRH